MFSLMAGAQDRTNPIKNMWRISGFLRLFLRFALPAAVAIGALSALWTRHQNLALHKPVEISAALLGNPENVVNGFVEWGSYGVHSKRTPGPAWLRIDLGTTFSIGEVRVFGRGDGYHTDSPRPISIELSTDGDHFKRATVCDLVVTQASPCRASIDGTQARYVRLSHPTHLVLSEVEVFEAL